MSIILNNMESNFKSNPCTDIEQSKCLLKPDIRKETADCGHFYGRDEHTNEHTPHPIKWEYKVEHGRLNYLSMLDKLSELGNEGWELCAYSDETHTAVFKRVKY